MWTAIVLLWLAGNALRITILAVPPVIAMIRDEFALSATEVGLLSSIPPALFAIAALAGSLLGRAFGRQGGAGRRTDAGGSGLGAARLEHELRRAVRDDDPDVGGRGDHAADHATPRCASGCRGGSDWAPRSTPTGLLVGEVFPVLLTIPFVLPMVGGSWRSSLVFWSLPIAIIAVVVYFFAPRSEAESEHAIRAEAPRKWLPDWHVGLVWRLGGLLLLHQRHLLHRQRLHSHLSRQRWPGRT